LLHFLTEKGRGFAPAENDPERAHGVSPPSAKVPAPRAAVEMDSEVAPRRSFTKVFGEVLCTAAEKDLRIHAITAAMPSGTGLGEFSERFPERFHDTGITEQHAVALAGGMATVGKRPVVAIYSTFLQRGYDQVFQEVALQEEDVLFCLDRAGLVGQDGPTHMGLYDMAYLRPFPGMVLASPRDAVDLERMMLKSFSSRGPWALRWPRGTTPDEVGSPASLRPEMVTGTAELLRTGHHGAVFALGAMVEIALDAANQLKASTGLEIEVYDARFCKPLDRETILGAAAKFGWLATVEEHAAIGGFGSAVDELLADHSGTLVKPTPCRLLRHAVPDRFIDHMNSRDEQLASCRLDAASLASAWAESLQTSNRKVATP